MFSSGCCHHIICGTFWAQPAWWVVLHFLLMITHCQCFLPTVFSSCSLSFSLLYHSFYCCSAFELSFFPGFCTLPLQVYLWKVYLKFQLSSSVSFRCIYYCLSALLSAFLCLFPLRSCVLKSTCTKMYIFLAITDWYNIITVSND